MPICESYVSAMRAMGHHTLLDNSEQKGALAGASTDMGSSTTFIRVSDLPRLTAPQAMCRMSYRASMVFSVSQPRG
jgi:hypothetical protein